MHCQSTPYVILLGG
ncbi:hypothetical protein Anas_01105 [Armadillidium nasatum]|uniref:Uncharacterized protein n=1 Tax=Armadillidium nasatum TaxID=96803 RepID=A0A5N5SNT7_9CRUS|nr:hypothetical protein Anas_01105 [Armadillidium nasatum]